PAVPPIELPESRLSCRGVSQNNLRPNGHTSPTHIRYPWLRVYLHSRRRPVCSAQNPPPGNGSVHRLLCSEKPPPHTASGCPPQTNRRWTWCQQQNYLPQPIAV